MESSRLLGSGTVNPYPTVLTPHPNPQYFAVGLIYGGLPATIYGLFMGYLNVPSYVFATASVITTLPWSFKFLFGMINDCFPIYGYHRKPYMVIG